MNDDFLQVVLDIVKDFIWIITPETICNEAIYDKYMSIDIFVA